MGVQDVILKIRIDGANEELKTLEALQLELNGLAAEKKALAAESKKLEDAIKANTITEEEAAAEAQKLAAAQVELNLTTKETKKEYQEAEKALLNTAKQTEVAEGSIAQMRLELSKAQKAYVNLSAEERNNAAIGGVMQQQIKAQSDELKKLEKDIGITSRSVGDYGQAVEGILPILGSFGQSIQSVLGTFGEIKTALSGIGSAISSYVGATQTQTTATIQNTAAVEANTVATEANTAATVTTAGATQGAATATGFFSKALRVLKVAIAATGIGLLIIALGSLFAFLTKSQEGMDKLGRLMGGLKAVVSVTVKALANFGKGLYSLFAGVFDVIESGFLAITGDFTGAQKKFEEGSKKMSQATTDMAKAFDGYSKSVGEAYDKGKQLYDLEQQRIKTSIALKDRIAELNRESELSEEIEGNNTLSWNERTQAIIKAAKAQSQAAKLTAQLIQNEIDILKESQKLAELTTEQKVELADKERELYEANTQAIIKGANIRKIANQLEQDLIEKNLDILIDGFDNQKTINEQLIADEKRSFEFRKKLLEETKELQAIALKNEVKEIEKTTDKKININDLIATSDAKVLNDKIRLLHLSEIMEQRLLEVIRDNRTATQDLATADKELNEQRVAFLTEVIKQTEDLKAANIENANEQAKEEERLRIERERAEIQTQLVIAENDEQLTKALKTKLEQLEIEHLETIQQINIDALKEQNDKEAKLLEISLLKQGATREEIEKALKENRILSLQEEIALKKELNEEAFEEELELEKLKAEEINAVKAEQIEKEKQIRTAAIDAIDQAQNIVFQNQNRRIDQGLKREIDALNIKLTKGEISEAEFDKKRLELEKKAFERKKRLDTAQALINGALAITRIAADVPKADYGIATGIMIGAQVVQTAAQVAAIQSQKFAKGGLIMGASHSQGGVILEAEGGEAIINKKSTAKYAPLLSAINQEGGGVPIPSSVGLAKFARGGMVNGSMPDFSTLSEQIKAGVEASISQIKIVNVASETNNVANRVKNLQESASF